MQEQESYRSRRAAEYGEASIRVLKGLEPVKQRPGMYTRTDSPLHAVQEVIDNASDEILAGSGSRIDVTLHKDGSVTVDDDGRGIPVGLHPDEKAPVVEIVFTRLHAGGKFDKRAGGAYSFSGGLHGVGVSVTNALASRLDVTVWRDGKMHTIGFGDGDVRQPLKSAAAKGHEQDDRHAGHGVAEPEVLRHGAGPGRRARAPAAQQGRAAARHRDHADAREERSDAALEVRGRAARIPAEPAAGRSAAAAVRIVGVRRGRRRELRRRRGRELGRRVDRRRCARARIVREPHPHAGRRHARGGAARRALQRRACIRRCAQPAAQGREAAAGGRLRARELRALGQGARSAVPGADQGAVEQPRCAAPGLVVRPPAARVLAEPASERGAAARRTRGAAGAGARASQPEGREEEGLGGRSAARQADRLRVDARSIATSYFSSRATPPADRRRWAATRSSRRSCRCAARC